MLKERRRDGGVERRRGALRVPQAARLAYARALPTPSLLAARKAIRECNASIRGSTPRMLARSS
jgi:hypothetical protein